MSVGASWAGVNVMLALEVDKHAAATYRKNHRACEVICDDIKNLDVKTLKRQLKANRLPTILFGGPPCQGFSYSNTRTRDLGNAANWLFREFIRVCKQWKPDFVVFENVKGIVDTAGGQFRDDLVDQLQNIGYTLSHGLLNAVDFGVAQDRTRFFIIGSKNRKAVQLPSALTKTPTTVREAIYDLPKLANGWNDSWMPYETPSASAYARRLRGRAKKCGNHLVTRNSEYVIQRYKHIPEGGNWEDIPRTLMSNYKDATRCHTGIYHRLSSTQPSVVIGNFRKNMLIHPTEHRGLSVREAARIQSFPDSYEFLGSIGFQQQQVGNAVPPLLARAVFKTITNFIKG